MKRWADRWMLFLLCLVYLAISVVVIPFAWSAGRNDGTPGTFTAVERICSRSGCDWRGTFVSDDGRIRDDSALHRSSGLERPGDQVRAQKGVGSDESIYAPSSRAWITFSLAAVGCLAYVVWWLVRRRRERRARVPARSGAAPIERILLRGGPRDGMVLEATDLPPAVTVHSDAGEPLTYRQTGDHEQLRGIGMTVPLVRTWTYAWVSAG